MLTLLDLAQAANGPSRMVPPPPQDSKVLALADNVKLPDGERYEAMVPDTLDLAERCRVAVHGLVWSVSDTNFDHEPYASVVYRNNPPFGGFNNGIGLTASPKYAEALPMARVASGSEEGLETEIAFMRAYLARVSPLDGLHYATRITPLSKKDRPWHNDCYPVPKGKERIKDEDMADAYYQGRHILAMLAWYERSGNKEWLPVIRKSVRGLESIAIQKGDYAYFPDGECGQPFNRPRSGWVKTAEARAENEGGEGSMFMYHGGQIRAFARYFKLTGDRRALEMARKLSRYVLRARFWGASPSELLPEDREKTVFETLKTEDPVGRADGHWHNHAHGHASVLRGLLELAEADNDKRLMEFVRSSYEYTVQSMSDRKDEGREFLTAGYELYPRVLGTARIGAFGETCMIADMVALAIRLTEDGMGDYWDDVDRWVRNHLVERQLTSAECLRLVADHSTPTPANVGCSEDQIIRTDVIDGALGLFSIFSHLNRMEWEYGKEKNGAINSLVCCSCNGAQALYYAWESIVRKNGNWIDVNLLLNRASPWLDVDSYLPYEGKVVVRTKTAENVRIRLSDWIQPRALTVTINSQKVVATRRDKFVEFVGLKPEDVIILSYPVPRGVEQIGKYACTFRGHTLCKIEPQADPAHYPIYQREKYLQDTAPMKRVSRYVSPTVLTW